MLHSIPVKHSVRSSAIDFFPLDSTRSPPHSAYPLSANPSSMMHYGSDPTGTLGVHHPKEIVRIERDWSGPAGGQVCQFYTSWVMELEGRVRLDATFSPISDFELILSLDHNETTTATCR